MKVPQSTKALCVIGWAVLILVPTMILGGIAIPWLQRMQELDSQITENEDQLGRLRRLVATLPRLREELEKVNSNEDFKAFYFDAPTTALAGAELQRKVQDIVTEAKGRLISTQLLPERKDEHPTRVLVRTQIQGSTETLLDVLYQIELARPFLFIDQVSVRSSARPAQPERSIRGRAIRRPNVNQAGELTVRLDIFGFALGGDAG
jgi:general secretion pathway protein M